MTWIDALKGIAILLVVAVHCGVEGLPRNIARFVSTGGFWVQLFMLFTVMLTMSSLERLRESGSGAEFAFPCWRWYAGKFLRLAPLYYVALVVSAWATGGCAWWLGSEGSITWQNMAAHVFFIHGLFPHYADSVIGVEWYIGVVAQFLVIAPLLHRHVRTLPRALLAFVLSVILANFLRTKGLACLAGLTTDLDHLAVYLGIFCLPASLPTIFLGVMAWRILSDRVPIDRERRLVAIALYIAFVILYNGLLRNENQLHCVSSVTLGAMVFALLVVAMSIWKLPLIDNQVLGFLGRHSYGIYLFHMIIVSVIKDCAIPWPVRFVVSGGGALLIAIVLERVVERPVQDLFRPMIERRNRG